MALQVQCFHGFSFSLSSLSVARQLSCISSLLHAARSAASVRAKITGRQHRFQTTTVSCSLQPEDRTKEEDEVASSTSFGNKGFSEDYGVVAGLATIGFAETAYLTYMKLFGGPVSCPIGGGSCNDVLNSDYSLVFGVPLSAVGVLAYGTVVVLGVLGGLRYSYKVAGVDVVRWLLLGSTSVMATASGYFMYILSTKLEGASCSYCVASALLSVSLVLLTLRVRSPLSGKLGTWITNRFNFQEMKQVAGVQVAVTAAVILALSSAYADITPAATGSGDIDLPPVEPQITTSSSPTTLSLAKYLQSVGAKMYGAFWCSHCYEQKQMFGREAMKYLDYVECYPEGYRRGVKIAKACESAKIDGFPTWIIKGQVLSGEQELSEIARVAGFEGASYPCVTCDYVLTIPPINSNWNFEGVSLKGLLTGLWSDIVVLLQFFI
ncbi:hypothetical protein GOP47_0021434 [Adiantum capillus-veneris]|uniref:Vitamin K epoxide reductase domain-containing protein n=1 Tax=Adiantum capillus-veneris TaxID=13818 RepID=A0A9D4Z6Y4_ADICA|nr:hypothetical protein GOP47_0021434 [Adiantum capillus-veneris]